jgi:thiamine pyrophosphokinase
MIDFLNGSDGVCYIVGAYPFDKLSFIKGEKDIIVCADGGMVSLKKNNIIPDVIMGDFDSLGYVPEGENVFVYPSEKHDSDISIAIKYGFDKGYKNFAIYGGFGGRFDHTFANVQMLSYIANRGGRGVILGDDTFLTVIKDQEISINGKGLISVFSLSDKSTDVTLRNLKYNVENAELTNSFPLGLSNEFVNDKTPAFIGVKNGTLLLVIDSSEKTI